MTTKPVEFIGDSIDTLRAFPDSARQDAGFQLDKVQRGEDPDEVAEEIELEEQKYGPVEPRPSAAAGTATDDDPETTDDAAAKKKSLQRPLVAVRDMN